jgi:hypothetical protein
MSLTSWMDHNLRTQGYCLAEEQSRSLAVGLRFPTAACLGLVITGLVLESAPMLFVLSGIGAVAGFTPRHPFDHVWNGAVRHAFGAPPLPANPPRRRHAFKIAAAWLLGVATLLAVGATTAGLVLGGLLVAACSAVTAFNLCLPSLAFEQIDRFRRRREPMPV